MSELSELKQESKPVDATIRDLAKEIMERLGVRKNVEIRISEKTETPFVFGVFSPTILLPRKLVVGMPMGEVEALLGHEMAHLKTNDLLWSVGWKWVQAIIWFHPLVWKVAAVHSLACEEMADRLVSSQIKGDTTYAQTLARLALRIISIPKLETQLTANGAAEITQRLQRLGCQFGAWKWPHTMAAMGLVFLLVLIPVGCKLASSSNLSKDGFYETQVIVKNEKGKPLGGIKINVQVFGLTYHTNTTTDSRGRCLVKTPDDDLSRHADIKIDQPPFCGAFRRFDVTSRKEMVIYLTNGVPIDVSGWCLHENIKVLALCEPIIFDGSYFWREKKGAEKGHFISYVLPGKHTIHLAGPSGYSDYVDFVAEPGKPLKLDLEVKPGVDIIGHIDDKVPRPITNGFVFVKACPPNNVTNANYYDLAYEKRSEPITIDTNGDFFCRFVQPGKIAVFALGDEFISKQEVTEKKGNTPQTFFLESRTNDIVVSTERPAIVELLVQTEEKIPVTNAYVSFYFGVDPRLLFSLDLKGKIPIYIVTDKNGKVVFRNAPRSVSMTAFSMDRVASFTNANQLCMGETNKFVLTLKKKKSR